MRDYIVTGKKGEELAVDYLKGLGFQIIDRNWRYRRAEIDVIATFENVLHFIEVKTRTSLEFGYPEEGVTRKKINTLVRAGAAYCARFPGWPHIQFDVLAILFTADKTTDYLFIQDVYL